MPDIEFHSILAVLISLLPVFVFLISLILIDTYKLMRARAVVNAILYGCFVAGVSFLLNRGIMTLGVDLNILRRYLAPLVEEIMKASFLIYLLKTKKVGFMVDAAISGFAVGAGFSFIENIYYVTMVPDASIFVWIIRGFGTAIMHGGTTSIVAILAKNQADYQATDDLHVFGRGLLIAIVIHSYFNHFFLHPLFSPLSIIVGLPLIMTFVFAKSEKATREWLGVGFDTDVELLNMLTSGNLRETKIGVYLQTLQRRFRGEVIVDMICYLRIYLELSIRAKGVLLMREAGFSVPPETDTKDKFTELAFLDRNIGKTGKLALLPFLRTSNQNLWQLNMLERT